MADEPTDTNEDTLDASADDHVFDRGFRVCPTCKGEGVIEERVWQRPVPKLKDPPAHVENELVFLRGGKEVAPEDLDEEEVEVAEDVIVEQAPAPEAPASSPAPQAKKPAQGGWKRKPPKLKNPPAHVDNALVVRG